MNGIICRYDRCEGDQVLIGELDWDERPGATYEVHIDVKADYRLRGIGRSMFEELETQVRDNKGMSIYTFIASDNDLAKAFFTAMGMTLMYVNNFYGEGRHAMFGVKSIGKPE